VSSRWKDSNYSANIAAITLAPSKGRLCGAKRGGENNYSPEKGTPDQGVSRNKMDENRPFSDVITVTIYKIW
jgi:hypothetical protein